MSVEAGGTERVSTSPQGGPDSVRERLAGRRVLLTGATGFLGKAVMASLLRTAPELGRLVVLLRAPDTGAARRRLLEDVLQNDAFDGLPPADLRRWVDEERIVPFACDLESPPPPDSDDGELAAIDLVIHCAATVSFEEPLDDALTLNTFGPARLLRRVRAAGSEPHVVHVSTAYVADRRSGEVEEDGEPHHALAALDPEALLAEGRELRASIEAESRQDPQRSRFRSEAERDAARRRGMDAVQRAEDLRRRWVLVMLSRRSRMRAKELGWPDTYALSKALGERVLK